METQVTHDVRAAEGLARSAVYRFLSLAFLPPEDGLETLRAQGAAATDLLRRYQSPGEKAAMAEAACRVLAASDGAALREEYYRIFGHQISRDCPLYETQYGGAHIFQQAQQLADIAGFYLAFGLEAADGVHERADHISLELEFMQALTFREAYARMHHGPGEVDLLQEAQRAFLRDHLSHWVPVLARLIRQRGDGFYRDVADLAASFVAADAAAQGLPPAEEAEYSPPVSLEGEGSAFPCGTEACPLEPQS